MKKIPSKKRFTSSKFTFDYQHPRRVIFLILHEVIYVAENFLKDRLTTEHFAVAFQIEIVAVNKERVCLQSNFRYDILYLLFILHLEVFLILRLACVKTWVRPENCKVEHTVELFYVLDVIKIDLVTRQLFGRLVNVDFAVVLVSKLQKRNCSFYCLSYTYRFFPGLVSDDSLEHIARCNPDVYRRLDKGIIV